MAHQFYQDVSNVPNKISIGRIFLILVCVILFYWFDLPILGSTIGLIAGLSDYADGIYARKHNMCTQLGALLDQVADLLFNFLVMSAAIAKGVWPLWILFLWGLRDLSVLSMRASAAQLGFDIPSIYMGKLASAVIYYSLFIMPIGYALTSENYQYHQWVADNIASIGVIGPYIGPFFYWICFAGVIVGIVLQWITAVKYARTYIQKYDEIHKAKKQSDPETAPSTKSDETPQTDSTSASDTAAE